MFRFMYAAPNYYCYLYLGIVAIPCRKVANNALVDSAFCRRRNELRQSEFAFFQCLKKKR